MTSNPSIKKWNDYFNRLVKDNELVHAYLFTGEDYPTKEQVTINLIQALVCENFTDKPCQECSFCQRAKNRLLADVMYVEGDGTIKVDQIRQMKEWLYTNPLEVDCKLVVITEADLMTNSASNALLTILEEPHDRVYLILYAPSTEHVLQTIESRSQEIYFPATDLGALRESLENAGLESSHALVIANLAVQDSQRFSEEYSSAEFSNWLKALNYFYQYLLASDPMAFVVVQTHLKNNDYLNRQKALDGLDYLALINNHISLALVGANQADQEIIALVNGVKLIERFNPSLERLDLINEEIYNSKEKILANVNPQLAYEQLTIKLSKW